MAGLMGPAVSILIAYGVGSLPFAALCARLRGVDIRAHGSGNPGATNVGRVLGKSWGRAVLLLDVLKGLVPVLLLRAPPDGLGLVVAPAWVDDGGRVLVAAAAVLGHVFPVTMAFRGGKGVATLIGGYLALDPILGIAAVAIHVVLRKSAGFVSAASVALAWSFPLLQLVLAAAPDGWGRFRDGTAVLVVLAVLITLRHRDNFRRIRAGTEDRYDDGIPVADEHPV